MKKDRIVIIGAGITGLVVAYELQKEGKDVILLESEAQVGGFATTTKLGAYTVDRFYHFICRGDHAYLHHLKEIGLLHIVRWAKTSMGYLIENAVVPFGSLFSLWNFPTLSLLDKIRYLVLLIESFLLQGINVKSVPAVFWLQQRLGNNGYRVLWQQLLEKKLRQYAPFVSAEWLVRRIVRQGKSRIHLTEVLGYLEGGCSVLTATLQKKIQSFGGHIVCNAPVMAIKSSTPGTYEITTPSKKYFASRVVSTIPLPVGMNIIDADTNAHSASYAKLKYCDILCGVFLLNHSLSPYFWLNVSANSPLQNSPITGCIEYTNLAPREDGKIIVYIPIYTSTLDEDIQCGKTYWYDLCYQFFKHITPAFSESWIEEQSLQQGKFAQPICFPESKNILPPMQVASRLWCVDNTYFFPEDRSFQECVNLGKKIAAEVQESFKDTVQ